jgi:hypothetical protein
MKIYLATEMGGSPFTDPDSVQILKDFKCCIVDKISDAEVVVAHNYKKLLPRILRYPKKHFLVWTNEPRYDTTFKDEINLPFGLPNIHVMNVYGKEVFWHNLHFLASYHFANANNLGIDINKSLNHLTKEKLNTRGKKNKIAALFTNTLPLNNRLMKNGANIDLSHKRCEYALTGYSRKLLDIYGNKWPNGYALDNSGFGFEKQRPWWTEKIEILNAYKFNLCFENTAHHYYVTEKIWHAILSNNLPIYSSFNSSIYETFPKDSFIDANLFKDEHELFDYVEAMGLDEYLERLNACIDVFNQSLQIKRDGYEMNANEIISKIIYRLINS